MGLFPLGKAEEREERGKGEVEKALRLPPGPRAQEAYPLHPPVDPQCVHRAVTSETAHPDGLLGATEGRHCLEKWRSEEGRQVSAGLRCREEAGRRGRLQGSGGYSKGLW